MRALGTNAVLISAVAALLFSGTTAHSKESGKIYVADGWVSADNSAQEISASPTASIFGDLFGSSQAPSLGQIVSRFLKKNAGILNTDADTSWKLEQSVAGPELQTQRAQKVWRGLPVIGGDAVVHLAQGEIAFANADNTSLISLSSATRINAEEAAAIAYASYQGKALSSTSPALKVLLLDTNSGKEARLVFEVTVRDRDQFASDIHFIDAQTGEEVMVSTNVHTLSNRQVVAGLGEQSDFALDDTTWKTVFSDAGCAPVPAPGGPTPGTSPARRAFSIAAPLTPCFTPTQKVLASASSAWANSGLVHQYYESIHGRNSIDGKGMTLKSVVNFGGAGFPNAAWYDDKGIMLYGVGDETIFTDFAAPLDVAAHEITHGVTARTANLEYVSESGALNESYSDIFGRLVAFKNKPGNEWKIGKELFRDGVRFIRDMENPQIGHTNNFQYKGQPCSRANDFCGVHSNSGIPNKAAVLLAKRIGNDKLGKLYYLTLTQLLRTNSNFKEAKAQTEAACARLFGAASLDCKAVTESFAAVGI